MTNFIINKGGKKINNKKKTYKRILSLKEISVKDNCGEIPGGVKNFKKNHPPRGKKFQNF